MRQQVKIEELSLVFLLGCFLHVFAFKNKHLFIWCFVVLITLSLFIYKKKIFSTIVVGLFFIISFYFTSLRINNYHKTIRSIQFDKYKIHQLKISEVIYKPNQIQVVGNLINNKSSPKVKGTWPKSWLTPIPGQYLEVDLKVVKPRNYANPGSFDLEKDMFVNGLHGTFITKYKSKPSLIINASNIRIYLHGLLSNRISFINKSNLRFKGLYASLALGQPLINYEDKLLLQNVGLAHILAVSGLHISIITSVVYLFSIRLFKSLSISRFFSAISAWIFGVVSGFSIATKRAICMFFLSSWCKQNKLNYPISSIIASALIIVLLFNPLSYLSVSFWLSFFCIVIIHSLLNYNKQISFFKFHLYFSFLLLPLNLLFFGNSPLLSPFVNMIFLPVFGLFILPGILIANLLSLVSEVAGLFIFNIVDQLLSVIWPLLILFDRVPIFSYQPSIFQSFIILLSSLIIFMPVVRSLLIKVIIFISTWFYILLPYNNINKGEFTLTQLDVGQGNASIIRTRNHIILYDTGPKTRRFDSGKSIVYPYLKYNNINKVDYIIVSHNDLDHSGGLSFLLKNISYDELILSSKLRLEDILLTNNINPLICKQGQYWIMDNVHFEFISPGNNITKNANDMSCVLQIRSKTGKKAILTGDISKRIEKKLINVYGDKLQSDVLIAPHHGSKYSSDKAFIAYVNPKYTMFSAGFKNQYRHPHPNVINRYLSYGSKIYSTINSGAIGVFFSDNDKISIYEYKSNNNFWNS